MIGITVTGNESPTTKALMKMKRTALLNQLNAYGQQGVALLASATPVDSALTASSWAYRVVEERNGPRVEWYNTHADDNGQTSVAVLIQYGHGTKNGGYVQGRDYINPAIQPMFDKIINGIWEKVKSA
jgi:hypothetical protein